MPTEFQDQVWSLNPFAPPPVGTVMTVSTVTLTDFDDDDDIEGATGDLVNGEEILQSWPGDTVTVELSDGSQVTVTGITFEMGNGVSYFTPTDGSVLEEGTFVSSTFVSTEGPVDRADLGPVCFTLGTRLIGSDGASVLIDDLKIGDRLLTTTNGVEEFKTIRWIARRELSSDELRENRKLFPVRISAGALGAGLPERDLVVSRQHRMLVRSKVAERMFGQSEVLVSAVRLCPLPGIFIDESVEAVTYVHILFDDHEILTAEGCETESLYTGPAAMQALAPEMREEVQTIFPELKSRSYLPTPARVIPKGSRQKQLINRIAANRHTVQ